MSEFRKIFPWTAAIARAMRPLRWFVVLPLVIWLAVGLAIHIRAQVFRWQARRLLNDVRSLEMEKTPAADALKLRARWPDPPLWPDPDPQPCTNEKCDFTLTIREWRWINLDPNRDTWWREPARILIRGFEPFGLRQSAIFAEVRIRHGVVAGMDEKVYISTQDGLWPFSLGADATAWPNLFLNSAPDEHPNLHVGYIGSPGHGGCIPKCRGTYAYYTPQISREEFLRVTNFDLSCLTSLHLCKDFGDMMPEVKRLVEQDTATLRHSISRPCTLRTMRTLGRDSLGIALMKVKRVLEGHPAAMVGDDSGYQDVEYELIEKLKWRSHDPLRTRVRHQLWFSGTMVDSTTHLLSPSVFQPGQQMVVLFGTQFINCQAFPATPENLAAVRQGIADDRNEFWWGRKPLDSN